LKREDADQPMTWWNARRPATVGCRLNLETRPACHVRTNQFLLGRFTPRDGPTARTLGNHACNHSRVRCTAITWIEVPLSKRIELEAPDAVMAAVREIVTTIRDGRH
jgi:hypothetical protein